MTDIPGDNICAKCGHKQSDHNWATDDLCKIHGCPCGAFELFTAPLTQKTQRITLDKLLFKPNAPAGMNPLVVMSLAYYFRSGVMDSAPIVVKREGENYRIMDGRHRVMASMIAGRSDVLAVVEY